MDDAFKLWRAELLRVGQIVQDDATSVPQPEAEARFNRYLELLQMPDGSEGDEFALAIVESIQAKHDYGAYQRAIGALDRFAPPARCAAVLRELPRLMRTLPDWAGDLLLGLTRESDAPVFNSLLLEATPEDQRLIREFITKEEHGGWLQDDVGVLGAVG